MAEPVPESSTITIKNTSASTSEDILTGDHAVSEAIIRLNREWRPKEASAQRFKDNVISILEGLINNTNTTVPDQGEEEPPEPPPGGGGSPELFYDSGYVYFKCDGSTGDIIPFNHNLGQVPTRFTLFYSPVANPTVGTDTIYVIAPGKVIDVNSDIVGVDIKITGQNTIDLAIGKDFLSGGGALGIPLTSTP